MSTDKDNARLINMTDNKNSIFALKISPVTGKEISGEIYYFNKNEDDDKKIQNLSEFYQDEKKIHIIVYNGVELAYYKPGKGKINDAKLVKKLNEYVKRIIININFNGYINTYIFLSEELTKHDTGGIFDQMKKEHKATFEKHNLINIVKALFNIIEDYHINIDGVKKKELARTGANVVVEDQGAAQAGEVREVVDQGAAQAGEVQEVVAAPVAAPAPAPEEERRGVAEREIASQRDKAATAAEKRQATQVRVKSLVEDAAAAEEQARADEAAAAAEEEENARLMQQRPRTAPAAARVNRHSVTGGRGKRKYKANVNQKSLKKMSTIIKKLLKINLNIKPAAKPKAKPAAKLKAKPAAKPVAKPVAKPAAKPTAKPKAEAKKTKAEAKKPKAEAKKPKAETKIAKTEAKIAKTEVKKPKVEVKKPKAVKETKPKAESKKPKAKPAAKPATKPVAKPKAKK